MMEEGQMQAAVLRLLDESGITRPALIDDIRISVRAGEVDLAFDLLCTQIDEDELPISAAFHDLLSDLAASLRQEKWAEELRPLVREDEGDLGTA